MRLVPGIPRICVQIKLEVYQIDPMKTQGWNLGDMFLPYGPGKLNEVAAAWSHVPQGEIPAPSLEINPREQFPGLSCSGTRSVEEWGFGRVSSRAEDEKFSKDGVGEGPAGGCCYRAAP